VQGSKQEADSFLFHQRTGAIDFGSLFPSPGTSAASVLEMTESPYFGSDAIEGLKLSARLGRSSFVDTYATQRRFDQYLTLARSMEERSSAVVARLVRVNNKPCPLNRDRVCPKLLLERNALEGAGGLGG
jgi:hypothetical protein